MHAEIGRSCRSRLLAVPATRRTSRLTTHGPVSTMLPTTELPSTLNQKSSGQSELQRVLPSAERGTAAQAVNGLGSWPAKRSGEIQSVGSRTRAGSRYPATGIGVCARSWQSETGATPGLVTRAFTQGFFVAVNAGGTVRDFLRPAPPLWMHPQWRSGAFSFPAQALPAAPSMQAIK